MICVCCIRVVPNKNQQKCTIKNCLHSTNVKDDTCIHDLDVLYNDTKVKGSLIYRIR